MARNATPNATVVPRNRRNLAKFPPASEAHAMTMVTLELMSTTVLVVARGILRISHP